MLVIDDHLLLDILAGTATGPLAHEASTSTVYTTSSWYYRVASATEQGSGDGSLSRRLTSLSDPDRRAVRTRLLSLPEGIGMIGPRTLVPVMAALPSPRRLNFLSSEALAVAIVTESSIAVRTNSPPLREACDALRVPYRIFETP